MARFGVGGVALGCLLLAAGLAAVSPAEASSVTATSWIELDGSGTRDGLSRSAAGVRALERDVSVAVDSDGDPVVAYIEAVSGNVVVKQLIAGAWQQLGTPPGQGVTPRVKVHTDGTVNVAWLGPTAVFLAQWTGTAWVGLAGSNTGTGLTGAVNPLSFDFALDQDGHPVVALDAPPASGADCLDDGASGLAGPQIYVVQWSGSAWNYLGSDPTGGGASNALSFDIPGTTQVVCHSAVMPSVAVDSDGAPVVAFVYTTGSNEPAPPATFYIGTNTDVYAARWDGAGWLGVGPEIPTQPAGAGLGQAGGISANANASAPPGSPVAPATPSIAIGTDNRPVVAWSDNSADPNQTRVLLRKFSQDVRTFNIATAVWAMIGTNTSTSTVISPTSGRNELPVVAIGELDRPFVVWQTIGPTGAASVYIRRFNGTTGFVDVTTGSASGTGVNGADVQGLAPALAVGPEPSFTPIVAWLGGGVSAPQAFARELGTGAMSTLTVTLAGGGSGSVTSVPSGISCPTLPGACTQVFPLGTTVTLTATPDPGVTFSGWSGGCTNTSGPCVLTLSSTTRAVTATFAGAKLTVAVTGTGSGIAVSAPAGIACGLDCVQSFALNTPVTVTATAFPGSSFSSWSGCVSVGGPGLSVCQVTMTGARTITARFTSFALTVAKTGAGSGTVTGSAPGGGVTSVPINCGSICRSASALNTTLNLTATPDPGSVFASWSGCNVATGPSCSVTMGSDRTVTANFTTNRLTVTKVGTGTGTVTSVASPPNGTNTNINCGTACVSNIGQNTTVTLTAVPASDSSFTSWSGCSSVNGSTCTVITTTGTSSARTVTAHFSSVTLKVAKNGTGTGTVVGTDPGALINCGSTCSQKFPQGTVVHLQASNTDPSSAFTGWAGCPSTNGSVCTVTMSAAKTVTATFASNPLKVTVSRVGGATGTVVGVGNPIDCGQLCQAGFPPNAQAVVRANPAQGSVFTRWAGCTSVANNECTVTMNTAKTVTVTFTSMALRVNITGAGTVVSNPVGVSCTQSCTGQFEPNTTVQLTPTPSASSAFTSWSGCASTNGSVCTVVMSAARTVTATFTSRRLTVTKVSVGGGAGTVDGPGFTCGQVCFQDLPPNTQVTLTATPDDGSGFGGWTNCTTPNGTQCTVTMTAAKTVTATFSKFKLTVSRSGSGSVESDVDGILCPSTCAASFAAGTTVVLTATPGDATLGATFTGCAIVTGNTCTVTMSQARTVTVVFAKFTLTVRKTGTGSGTVTSDVGGINCFGTCSVSFPAGTTVTLTAIAGSGSVFSSFTGCTPVAFDTCTVVMTAAKSVSAAFQALPSGGGGVGGGAGNIPLPRL